MTTITDDPRPPFRAVEECLGHAFDCGTAWEVVDQDGHVPRRVLDARTPETVVDEAHCRQWAEALNREIVDPAWDRVKRTSDFVDGLREGRVIRMKALPRIPVSFTASPEDTPESIEILTVLFRGRARGGRTRVEAQIGDSDPMFVDWI